MIKVNIKYTTMNQCGQEVVRDTEWRQSGNKIDIEDLEHDHFANYIMTDEIEDADDIMSQNENAYGRVKSILSVTVTNLPPAKTPREVYDDDGIYMHTEETK